jgi:broad specificity phosphatase PhoE
MQFQACSARSRGNIYAGKSLMTEYLPPMRTKRSGVFRHLIDTYRADSLDELSDKRGIEDKAALRASVERYNELCKRVSRDVGKMQMDEPDRNRPRSMAFAASAVLRLLRCLYHEKSSSRCQQRPTKVSTALANWRSFCGEQLSVQGHRSLTWSLLTFGRLGCKTASLILAGGTIPSEKTVLFW